ncbi:MAG: TIGR03087 family PEP-CTERM/XrtA system glycosyltransferase [Nitrospirae bacterium]|nr:TIGR03087 family PEP-CTERM/XrtA system glycosyltransferase [Nitrospirota bacterium]
MSGRPSILFIAHRVPFPPNKGDKIRNYHVIEALAAHFDVHLLAFREGGDPRRVPEGLARLCASAELVPIAGGRFRSLLRALRAGISVSEAHYRRDAMARRVRERVAAHGITVAWAGSSALAPYLFGLPGRRYVDFMDVDSDKWRQYAERTGDPLSRWVYRREARRVADLEARALRALNAVFVVAPGEADLLAERHPGAGRVIVAGNGVVGIAPGGRSMAARPEAVVFTGAMDYWPNVDAVVWFAERVWPAVRAARPAARFLIVGSNPVREVCALGRLPGVAVTGTVPDVAPYLGAARVMVAPLRMARGIQNKVLEGMAAGLPVVTTPEGADGIDATDGDTFLVRADAEATARAVTGLLADPEAARALGERARRLMSERYGWAGRLGPILDELAPRAEPGPARREAVG